MESLYCRIYGRVQMVMYRDFAMRKARANGIFGFVRNLPDGSVEAYGEGTHKNILRWVEQLRRGPLFALVERVDESWGVSAPLDMRRKSFDSFDIVF